MADALYDFLKLVGFDHPLHTIIVPMVIGPVMAAPIFALIAWWFKKPTFYKTARQLNVLSFVMWFPAVIVGVLDWIHFYGASPNMVEIIVKLIGAGVLFLILLGNILLYKKLQPESKAHLVLYLAGAIVVSIIGYFGGNIVFGAKQAAAPQPGSVQTAGDGFKQVAVEKFTFEWKVNGAMVDMKLSYPTTGWIAVGFNKLPVMNGAHIIIGFVQDGKPLVEDHVATGHGHSVEEKNGGKSSITNVTGKIENGVTTLTWTMPLNTGNPKDIVLTPGDKIGLILAHGDASAQDFTSYHGHDGRFGTSITF